jgi:hypothetical protein
MPKRRNDNIEPFYNERDGVVVYRSVKESLQQMLDDGLLDQATSLVIAYSSTDEIDVRTHGSKWECHALAAWVAFRASRAFEDV